jgi:hypothetical protein
MDGSRGESAGKGPGPAELAMRGKAANLYLGPALN